MLLLIRLVRNTLKDVNGGAAEPFAWDLLLSRTGMFERTMQDVRGPHWSSAVLVPSMTLGSHGYVPPSAKWSNGRAVKTAKVLAQERDEEKLCHTVTRIEAMQTWFSERRTVWRRRLRFDKDSIQSSTPSSPALLPPRNYSSSPPTG